MPCALDEESTAQREEDRDGASRGVDAGEAESGDGATAEDPVSFYKNKFSVFDLSVSSRVVRNVEMASFARFVNKG